ncbi:MAG: hypothetical protein RLP02_39660, partial [Coleofasciculus sp. C2-GNP5-27]
MTLPQIRVFSQNQILTASPALSPQFYLTRIGLLKRDRILLLADLSLTFTNTELLLKVQAIPL